MELDGVQDSASPLQGDVGNETQGEPDIRDAPESGSQNEDGEISEKPPLANANVEVAVLKNQSPLDILDELYLEHIHEAFVLATHPGDNFIETSRLQDALRSLEMELSQNLIHDFIAASDPHAQGRISLQVFQVLALELMRARTVYGPLNRGSRADALLEAFKQLDTEATGFVEEAQLRQSAAVAGHTNKSELEELLLAAKAAGPAARALRIADRRASRELERRASQEAALAESIKAAEAAAAATRAKEIAEEDKNVDRTEGDGRKDGADEAKTAVDQSKEDGATDTADGQTATPAQATEPEVGTTEDGSKQAADERAGALDSRTQESDTGVVVASTQEQLKAWAIPMPDPTSTAADELSDGSIPETDCKIDAHTRIDYPAFVEFLTKKDMLPS